jgi:hypothetical protein
VPLSEPHQHTSFLERRVRLQTEGLQRHAIVECEDEPKPILNKVIVARLRSGQSPVFSLAAASTLTRSSKSGAVGSPSSVG